MDFGKTITRHGGRKRASSTLISTPVRRLIRTPLQILFLWFFVHSVIIIWSGTSDIKKKSDVAVVLGNKVNPDGTLSQRLKDRLDKALEGYQEGIYPNLIVSGGLGKEGHYEGTVMRDYLVEKGIPASAIVVDNEGNNSRATAENSKKILEERAWKSVTIISHYYHISRCKLAFRQAGIEIGGNLHADFNWAWGDLWSLFREWVKLVLASNYFSLFQERK